MKIIIEHRLLDDASRQITISVRRTFLENLFQRARTLQVLRYLLEEEGFQKGPGTTLLYGSFVQMDTCDITRVPTIIDGVREAYVLVTTAYDKLPARQVFDVPTEAMGAK